MLNASVGFMQAGHYKKNWPLGLVASDFVHDFNHTVLGGVKNFGDDNEHMSLGVAGGDVFGWVVVRFVDAAGVEKPHGGFGAGRKIERSSCSGARCETATDNRIGTTGECADDTGFP